MFERSLTLHATEYVQHINRLYNAVEHLLGWLKRISVAKRDPPGQWIPDFLDDLERLNTTKDLEYDAIQQPYIRLLIQDEHLKLKSGFAFESRRQTKDSTIVPRHNIVIGFYFPPEDYPMVDGEYPIITICINAMTINTIQLDGTRRLYKPLFDRFWLHKNLLTLNQLHVYTDGKLYYALQVFDSVEMVRLDHVMAIYGLGNQKTSHCRDSIGFDWDLFNGCVPSAEQEANLEYIKHCNNPTTFSYPYLRAANVIKRCWINHKLQKNRNAVGAEIRILPDVGVDVIAMAERHKQFGIANHPDRQLVDPPRQHGNYDSRHNLDLRLQYAQEAVEILSRLIRTESVDLELKDCHLSVKRLEQIQKK